MIALAFNAHKMCKSLLVNKKDFDSMAEIFYNKTVTAA